jgi:adenylosuccinate synthase
VARLGIRVGDIESQDFAEKYATLKANHLRIVQSYGSTANDFKIEGLDFETYEKQWFAALETLKQFELTDSEHYINKCLTAGKKVLAEGAQGSLLDIDFGSYPFVTSSNTISAGVCSGLGIAPSKVGKVFGVFKAYCTRVGSGPFPTELFDDDGKLMRDQGHEYGSTTGRPRRCGWLDMPALKYAVMLSGVTHLIMTKGDVLSDFETIRIATQYHKEGKTIDYVPFDDSALKPVYHDLQGWKTDITKATDESEFPKALSDYIRFIETESKTPVSIVSVGPDRKQTILR